MEPVVASTDAVAMFHSPERLGGSGTGLALLAAVCSQTRGGSFADAMHEAGGVEVTFQSSHRDQSLFEISCMHCELQLSALGPSIKKTMS